MDAARLKAAAHGDGGAIAAVSAALAAKDRDALAALSALRPSDLARLVLQLSPKKAKRLIALMPETPGIAVLEALDPSIRARLLDGEERRRIARTLARLKPADAAAFLAGAPADLVEDCLAARPDAAAVRQLMGAGEAASAIMRRRFLAASADRTIGEVVEEIRRRSDEIDRLRAVYVTGADGRLAGYLKVRDLILNGPGTRVGAVMRADVVAVSADTDREAVLSLAEERGLEVLPVVDAAGAPVGIVTPDELLEISRREADEDIKLMAGVAADSTGEDGAFAIVAKRIPWLAAGLVGSGIAALVVGAYEDALTEAAVLASLIPIVMSLAGNAGIQASTVTVQAMSAKSFWIGDLAGRTLREFAGALLNGAIVGLVVAGGILALSLVAGIERPAALALAAALTLVLVTLQASVVGSLVPILLDRLGFDPAVATGVFITTSNDVVGVLVFFLVATAIYL